MMIEDLLNSNSALRNKIASDIDVKNLVIGKLTTMYMILTDLANTIIPSKTWSTTTPLAETPSTATSPSQAWSLISHTETPPSENEEEDPDWPFVGRKGPLPPSPPLRQRDPTLDEIMEGFLSHTLYPLFSLSRHSNPRGVWKLEQNENAPIPVSLGKHKHARFHYHQQNSETDYHQYAI
jgi:hypothetical protein